MGHTGLNSILQIIKVRETAEHVLIQCDRYTEERSKLIDDLLKNGELQLTLKEILNPEGGDIC